MSRRKNGANKDKLLKLNEINQIDKRLKKKKVRESKDETEKLLSRRSKLTNQLKTKT